MTLKKMAAHFMALLSQYLASHNIRFTTYLFMTSDRLVALQIFNVQIPNFILNSQFPCQLS
jgi:hypothetical protein